MRYLGPDIYFNQELRWVGISIESKNSFGFKSSLLRDTPIRGVWITKQMNCVVEQRHLVSVVLLYSILY